LAYQNLIYDTDGGVGIIRFNRPEVRNALNWDTWMEFEDALKRLHADPNQRVAIVTGAGDEAFVAGADIRMLKERSPQDAINASTKVNEILVFMESMDEPVIAAINGYALGGGCELALACDIRLASDRAQIGQTEVRIGIMPGYGGNVRLLRLVGPGHAKEMIYSGKIISATALAKQIARGPAAVHVAKKSLFLASGHSYLEALRRDSELYGDVYKTQDFKEGVTAFLEKRKPVFKNH
jgi:enoyl-CoA hydratase